MTIYLGTIDKGADGKTLLYDAINAKLNITIDQTQYDFSLPERVTTPSPSHNTIIYIGPKGHIGSYGVKAVLYNRIHVSELGTIEVYWNTETKLSELLPKINAKYGILVTVDDIYDENLPTKPSGQTTIQVNLKFKKGSIIFYGEEKINLGTKDPTTGSVVFPSAGQLIHSFCDNGDKKGVFTDGNGAGVVKLIQASSPDCQITAPAQPPNNRLNLKSTLIISRTHYTDRAGITHASTQTGEGPGYAFVAFKLTQALQEDVQLKVDITYDNAESADIQECLISYGSSMPLPITLPATITVPKGQTDFTLKFRYKEDSITEGIESFNITVSKLPDDEKITNTDPLTVKFYIADASTGSNYPASGTVLETRCEGTTKVTKVADGAGGHTSTREEKSRDCGYSPPAKGTILSTRCEGTTQIDTVADGNDGSEEKRTENSAKCGYTG